jgi:hypothetical protein
MYSVCQSLCGAVYSVRGSVVESVPQGGLRANTCGGRVESNNVIIGLGLGLELRLRADKCSEKIESGSVRIPGSRADTVCTDMMCGTRRQLGKTRQVGERTGSYFARRILWPWSCCVLRANKSVGLRLELGLGLSTL